MMPPEPPSRRAAGVANPDAPQAEQPDADEATQRTESADTPAGFLGGLFARHPHAWMATALSVVFVLLGTGSVFAGSLMASGAPAEQNTPAPHS